MSTNEQLDRLITQAKEFGFTNAGPIDLATLRFMPEVRDMCDVNTCGLYDTNWTCPPACGTIEECAAQAASYQLGMMVQTTSQLDDPFDMEGMLRLQEEHQQRLLQFTPLVREQTAKVLPLGTSACIVCEECTYPDAPCRYPELAFPPMEAFGLWVSDVCAKNDIPYYYGEGTLTYIALYLITL